SVQLVHEETLGKGPVRNEATHLEIEADVPAAKKARVSAGAKRVPHKGLNFIPSRKTEAGDIYVCGTGDCAQLGKTEDVLEIKKPERLQIDGEQFVDICCGGMHTLALTLKGDLYSWGCNDEKALGRSGVEYVPEKVVFEDHVDIVQLAAGDSISAVLTSSGEIYLWGTFRTFTGLLGFVSQPGALQATPVKLKAPKGVQFVQIVAGNNHLLALTTKGTVYVVGDNEAGQLGLRSSSRHPHSTASLNLAPLALKNIVHLAAGGYHSFAVSATGQVYSWGQNNYFQCGIPEASPRYAAKLVAPTLTVSLTELSPIQKIVAGEHHTYILNSDASLYGVGRSDSGQLGVVGENTNEGAGGKSASELPKQVPLSGLVDIGSGSNHALAILPNTVYSWGFGDTYALGHGDDSDELSPKAIEALGGRAVLKVSGGGQHSVFLVKSA
ncbi:hypothetical protein L0F63_002821, partial [Massospora cicadina]